MAHFNVLKNGTVSAFSWVLLCAGAASSQASLGMLNLRGLLKVDSLNLKQALSMTTSTVPVLNYDQKLDHFDASNQTTFKQRYSVDSTYADGPSSPVIYYVCGEANCFGSLDNPDGVAYEDIVATEAQALHAYVVSLEHRYFGYSQPFDQLTTDNLKYLTVDNAIEDLASFQMYITKSMGLTGNWVSVGTSYPGVLSGYYRLKHPELVSGALADSAPVEAEAAFEDYDLFVAQGLGPQCLAAVKDANQQIDASLGDPTKMAQLKTLFGVPTLQIDLDLVYYVASAEQYIVQFGYESQLCPMITGGDHVQGMAQAATWLFNQLGWDPISVGTPQGADATDVTDYETSMGMRQWSWLECTEFGFFTIPYHDPSLSAESPLLNLQYNEDLCTRWFGNAGFTYNFDSTNQEYYDQLLEPSTSNIVYTSGATDPWSSLAITPVRGNNTDPNTSAYSVAGGSHWSVAMYTPQMQNPSPSVVGAVDLISQSFAKWLAK